MAAVSITATTVPIDGYNLTDSADFQTLVAGSGNGVKFAFDAKDLVVLKNDSGGAAVFTIKVTQPTKYSDHGLVIPDETISVANGKSYVLQLKDIFKDNAGNVTIECDVAGKVLVLNL